MYGKQDYGSVSFVVHSRFHMTSREGSPRCSEKAPGRLSAVAKKRVK